MPTYRFTKAERLKSQKEIEAIFRYGKSAFKFPVRCVYIIEPASEFHPYWPVRVAFSVPKRKIKHAVKRNLIKRRMKEVYRLNRNKYLDLENLELNQSTLKLVFVYQYNEVRDYGFIERGMVKVMKKVME